MTDPDEPAPHGEAHDIGPARRDAQRPGAEGGDELGVLRPDAELAVLARHGDPVGGTVIDGAGRAHDGHLEVQLAAGQLVGDAAVGLGALRVLRQRHQTLVPACSTAATTSSMSPFM